jgi:S1-C subfamily serine protease
VSLGTVPDFAFPGPGVRVDSVLEGSAAERAGVQAGDVLLSLGEAELATLRDLSEALRAHSPDDTVTLRVRRGDRELTLTATLTAR